MSNRKKPGAWKPAFLKALAQTGLVSVAAQRANVTVRTVQRARELKNREGVNLLEAQNFANAWDSALEIFSASVELEIHRRALLGIQRETPLFYKGEQIGTRVVQVYSDRLLMFLAKAINPKRFGPHTNTPEQFRLANLPPETSLLDEARERAKQRWDQLVPQILKVFRPQPFPPTNDESADLPNIEPNP
jgi:hypothetical protein